MGHKLTLDVPGEVYEPLVNTARETGQKPEELAAQWLAAAVQAFSNDPLEKFIGAIQSDVPDWADQHDKYIGQALMKEMRGERRKEDGGLTSSPTTARSMAGMTR